MGINLKMFIRLLFDLLCLLVGVLRFLITGRTTNHSYQSLVRLFCYTRGLSNEILSLCISCANKPISFEVTQGVLGDLSPPNLTEVVTSLNNDGYYVFKNRLPEPLCDKLLDFALRTPALVRPYDNSLECSSPTYRLYDRDKPCGVRYDYHEQSLVENIIVQDLLADKLFLQISERYLKAPPILDIVAMWWHTAFLDKPDSHAAQLFHFDMDRIKWLKFFIYLTDVSTDNGPHTFVSGSHKLRGIPTHLLQKGYQRLTDEEVTLYYGSERLIEFKGPRGTIIVEDTRGLHKGKHVLKGDRLLLQLQFCNSLFGANLRNVRIKNVYSDELRMRVSAHPSIYRNYL